MAGDAVQVGIILIIEDDTAIANLMSAYLSQAGYPTRIATDAETGLALFHECAPICIILDRMLPGTDGLSVCRAVRAESNVPVLFVTARLLERERIEGLKSGADDYIVKPFSFAELVARVEAVLRRSRGAYQESISFAKALSPFKLDEDQCIIAWKGQALTLTQSEYRLLYKFITCPGRVFSRDDLLVELYPYASSEVIVRAIDVHIGNIRKKLRQFGEEAGECIQTVRGFGYRYTLDDVSLSN